jgi:hypothetical protein
MLVLLYVFISEELEGGKARTGALIGLIGTSETSPTVPTFRLRNRPRAELTLYMWDFKFHIGGYEDFSLRGYKAVLFGCSPLTFNGLRGVIILYIYIILM